MVVVLTSHLVVINFRTVQITLTSSPVHVMSWLSGHVEMGLVFLFQINVMESKIAMMEAMNKIAAYHLILLVLEVFVLVQQRNVMDVETVL